MVVGLGGPADFVERSARYLKKAPVERPVAAPKDGYVTGIDTRGVGVAVVALGGGRTRPEDAIDHSVGITRLVPVGAEIRRGEPLALVHARTDGRRRTGGRGGRRAAYAIGDARPAAQKAVIRRVAPRG